VVFEFIARHWRWLLFLWALCSAALCVTRALGFIHWHWALVIVLVLIPLLPVLVMFIGALLWRP
jgi:uncharacterized membrane protein